MNLVLVSFEPSDKMIVLSFAQTQSLVGRVFSAPVIKSMLAGSIMSPRRKARSSRITVSLGELREIKDFG